MDRNRKMAVETTAQIEVLRAAVVLLVGRTLAGMAPGLREETLQAFTEAVSETPAATSFITIEATRFFEDVAAAIPRLAEKFADDVRQVMD